MNSELGQILELPVGQSNPFAKQVNLHRPEMVAVEVGSLMKLVRQIFIVEFSFLKLKSCSVF